MDAKVAEIIEAWARRHCALNGIDPDEDWRQLRDEGDGMSLMLDVAVPPEDQPRWRHRYGKPVDGLLRELAKHGYVLSSVASGEDDAPAKD